MSSSQASVLARKIESAKRGAPSASGLVKFTSAIGKSFEEAISSLLGGEFDASTECADAALPEAVAAEAGPRIYYWLLGENGAPCALAVLSPAFAAVISERLLGGDLRAPGEEDTSSLLDFQMSGVVADLFLRALTGVLAKQAQASPSPALTAKRGARTPAEALSGFEPMDATCITLRVSYDGHDAPRAVRLYFPAAFIDAAGLHADAQFPALRAPGDPMWPRKMRRNILNTEISLSAVLGRVKTNVGSLSRLEIGQIFDLDPDALSRIEIAATTDEGPAIVARARLGAYQSNKAVKLTTPIDPDFLAGL